MTSFSPGSAIFGFCYDTNVAAYIPCAFTSGFCMIQGVLGTKAQVGVVYCLAFPL